MTQAPPRHAAPPPAPPRRPPAWLWIVVAVLGISALVVAVGLVSGATPKQLTPGAPGAPAARPGPDEVTYLVTSDSSVSLTWVDAAGHTQQTNTARTPWRQTLSVDLSGPSRYSVLAQMNDPAGTFVTCRVTDNGRQVDTDTGRGAFNLADCAA